MLYRAIIVEDERFLAQQLQDIIIANCPEIEIVGIAHSANIAEEIIVKLKPDLVFMDIELPDMNAFELLEKLVYKEFDVIFTTAHEHYALQAFDQNSVHYLLKPIEKENIKRAVQKYLLKKQQQNKSDITEVLNMMQRLDCLNKKIRLPKMSGFTMVPVKDIIRLEAEGRYTKVFIKEGKPSVNNPLLELISLNIKELETQLSNHNFFRCHNSHLVNLRYIKSYTKGAGGLLNLENGDVIPVSKSNKDELLRQLSKI
jgi:two-component system LytT family response regulator